ncbi:hypothetical protein QVD17_36523 [Tagetes erecta]|uniref:Uncharacterized protein n=1 Tax=Tagetes erecta TaxID=13708 RepID=A0AAD8JWI2_TARER|nr:hypothetical protein QVD17_36523 [Tagetes erecta]
MIYVIHPPRSKQTVTLLVNRIRFFSFNSLSLVPISSSSFTINPRFSSSSSQFTLSFSGARMTFDRWSI